VIVRLDRLKFVVFGEAMVLLSDTPAGFVTVRDTVASGELALTVPVGE
jgi:hypothetical protein